MLQVRRNISTDPKAVEKVRLRVGRQALTITDRAVWHNRLDQIPNSLIIDSHIDTINPCICYFINKTTRSHYQVLVFLCKSAGDAERLVNTSQQNNAHQPGLLLSTYKNDIIGKLIEVEHLLPVGFSYESVNHGGQHSYKLSPRCRGNHRMQDMVCPTRCHG